jgi:hypothetical protein
MDGGVYSTIFKAAKYSTVSPDSFHIHGGVSLPGKTTNLRCVMCDTVMLSSLPLATPSSPKRHIRCRISCNVVCSVTTELLWVLLGLLLPASVLLLLLTLSFQRGRYPCNCGRVAALRLSACVACVRLRSSDCHRAPVPVDISWPSRQSSLSYYRNWLCDTHRWSSRNPTTGHVPDPTTARSLSRTHRQKSSICALKNHLMYI